MKIRKFTNFVILKKFIQINCNSILFAYQFYDVSIITRDVHGRDRTYSNLTRKVRTIRLFECW